MSFSSSSPPPPVTSNQGEEEEAQSRDPEPKRRFAFANLFMDPMNPRTLNQTLMKMEPFLRKMVGEEVEQAFVNHFHTSPSVDQTESGGRRTLLQLRFPEKLPSVLYTSNRVGSEDGEGIRIHIWDVDSEKVVTSGSLSSIKAEIVVLDSNFEGDGDDWTEEAFKAKILRERQGKRPLLTGELTTCLRDGVGIFGDISLSDNSSWVRSGKFRLGARMVPTASTRTARVREAVSEAFVVKDHRGESQKKHYPPRLGDETWRLKKISKDGTFHKRLASEGIHTVNDFLRSYYTDQSKLRQMLGGGGNSSKTLETIVEHASTNTCTSSAQMYAYYKEGEAVGLIFDYVYKNVGATLNAQSWLPLEDLSALQMSVVERLKCDAYKNIHQFVPFVQLKGVDAFNKQSLGLGTEQELEMQLVGCDTHGMKSDHSINYNMGDPPFYGWGLEECPSMPGVNFGHTLH